MRLIAAFLLAVAASVAIAADVGMVLCRSPVVANDYWNDLLRVNSTGVHVDDKIVAAVARKHGCQLVLSNRLRPVNFVSGMFEMTDGKVAGWASPESYILYVNRLPQSN